MRWVLLASLALLSAGIASAQSPVHFADPGLKAAVEDELWVVDPTPEDMLELDSLDASGYDVKDLTGLEYALNLRSFTCDHSEISDLSPLSGLHELTFVALNTNFVSDLSPLSGLENLTDLNIHDNDISDISPLAGLANLSFLDLHANQIVDISAVSSLSSLDTLILEGNLITDISPISGLGNLTFLRLGGNEISDLSPLSGLSRLDTLSLYGNRISDLSPLSGLSGLRSLILPSNEISDIGPLTSLRSLSNLDLARNPLSADACSQYIPQILANNPGIYLQYDSCTTRRLSILASVGGSVIVPGEGQFEFEEGETVRIVARANAGFAFTGFSGTYASGSNPLFLTMDRDHEIQANFAAVLDVIHVDDDASNDPVAGDTRFSDLQENGGPDHPFDSIQEAIAAAAVDATIFVHAGTYHESIDLLGKSVMLTGFDPQEPNNAAWPVLDGGKTSPVVNFTRGEDANCVLAGLIVTAGGERSVAVIRCAGASPTIVNCLVAGNHVSDPDGAVVSCADSHAAFINCTIANNYAGTAGAAVYLHNSPVTIANSILWDNAPAQIRSVDAVMPAVSYCNVAGGWPGAGNFSADPLFVAAGYWANRYAPAIQVKPDEANAVWVAGDYHLRSQAGRWDSLMRKWLKDKEISPCIDAGDPAASAGREPQLNGGIINLGAYGGTSEASKSPSRTPSP